MAAIEAAFNPRGARDPKSRTGEAIRIVGYSPTAARVLVVVLLPHEHPPQGLWHIATEAEHAEATRDVELPYRRRAGGTHPVSGLRLPAERIEQLRQLAEARGVEPSVLGRQWVTDQLDAAEQARDQAEERWERDLHATTDHLRRLLNEHPGA